MVAQSRKVGTTAPALAALAEPLASKLFSLLDRETQRPRFIGAFFLVCRAMFDELEGESPLTP